MGSYPGATDADALTYFARKYDELFASAVLLEQRLALPEVPSKDVADGLKTLRAQVKDATVVGDLDALAAKLDEIQSGIASKRTRRAAAPGRGARRRDGGARGHRRRGRGDRRAAGEQDPVEDERRPDA